MVRDNVKIEGLTIRGVLVKQCLFADDSTYFLKDANAFKELVKTIEIFSKFSSLKVNYNYQKSEAAWLGIEKNSKETPHKCQWVNLMKETVKILGIHFTYNKDLLQKLNLSRVKNHFNTVLNLWKNKNLTIYGRTEVVKTLALSKLLYVTNFIIPTEKFIDEVKSILTNFIWNGRKPKIKYKALISNINEGGINLKDFSSRITTQNIMWCKRMLLNTEQPWNQILNESLKLVGGIAQIGTNYSISAIPKNISPFYKNCLAAWAKFSNNEPCNSEDILLQNIWNNKRCKTKFNQKLSALGINKISDILDAQGKFKKLTEYLSVQSRLYHELYIPYHSVSKCVPSKWLNILKNGNQTTSFDTNFGKQSQIKANTKLMLVLVIYQS